MATEFTIDLGEPRIRGARESTGRNAKRLSRSALIEMIDLLGEHLESDRLLAEMG